MEEDPVELVRKMLAAFVRGDYEAALATFSPEVEGDFTHLADGRLVRGRDGVRSEVARWQGAWNDLTTESEAIGGDGDKVVVLVRQSGTGKSSGVPMEMRYGQVFTVRDGAVVAMKTYLDPERAIEDGGADPRS